MAGFPCLESLLVSVWLCFCLCMPHRVVISDVDKDLFFDQLHAVTAKIPGSEFLSHTVIGMVT